MLGAPSTFMAFPFMVEADRHQTYARNTWWVQTVSHFLNKRAHFSIFASSVGVDLAKSFTLEIECHFLHSVAVGLLSTHNEQ